MTQDELWRTPDRSRWFLIPAQSEGPPGDLLLCSPEGRDMRVHPAWVRRFEVSEADGRAFAREELGDALVEMKGGIDGLLASLRNRLDEMKAASPAEGEPATSNAVPAMFDLLKALPGLVGGSLSGERERVSSATTAATDLEARLKAAGIDVGDRLSAFPERLARLRTEFERKEGGS